MKNKIKQSDIIMIILILGLILMPLSILNNNTSMALVGIFIFTYAQYKIEKR